MPAKKKKPAAPRKKLAAPGQSSKAAAAAYIEIGRPAPDFDLPNQHDERRTLKQLRGKWVVLYFYPKDNTSGCTAEACRFREASSALKKAGAVVLGVSPDSVRSHAGFAGKLSLPFDLLADTEKTVCNAYGVWQEKSMYGRKYWGVVRTTYLIDPKGRVAARWENVKVAGHDAEVLGRLRELAAS
jgi:peroxiredoxin Q/BCP